MTGAGETIRRVLVALDGGEDDARTLAQAAALARETGAELAALFVEDADVLKLAQLPVLEVSLFTGGQRRPDSRSIERELRARAEAVRRRLVLLAEREHVAWTFQVWRGRLSEALDQSLREGDLVRMGRRAPALARGRLRHGRPPARHGGPAPAPVLALFETDDGKAAALRVLEVARGMAAEAGAPLSILAPVATPGKARRVRALAEAHLSARRSQAAWRSVRAEGARITAALAAQPTRTLVLDARGPAMRAGLLDDLLCAADAEAVLINRV